MYWIDCLPTNVLSNQKTGLVYIVCNMLLKMLASRNQANCQTDNFTFSAVMVWQCHTLTLFLTHGKEWQIYWWKKPPSLGHPFKTGVNNKRCAVKQINWLNGTLNNIPQFDFAGVWILQWLIWDALPKHIYTHTHTSTKQYSVRIKTHPLPP